MLHDVNGKHSRKLNALKIRCLAAMLTAVGLEVVIRILHYGEFVERSTTFGARVVTLVLFGAAAIELVRHAIRPLMLNSLIILSTALLIIRPFYGLWVGDEIVARLSSGSDEDMYTLLGVFTSLGYSGWFIAIFMMLFQLLEARGLLDKSDAALRNERGARKRTEILYQELVENAQEIISRQDRYGVIQYISPSVERILGYSIDELLGKKAISKVIESDRERLSQFYEGRSVESDNGDSIKFTMLHKNGQPVQFEQTVRAIQDDDSTELNFISVARDVSSEVQATQARQESEDQYRRLSEAMNVIHWEASLPEWKFTYISPRVVDLLGYTQDEWYQDGFWPNALHPDDRKEAVDFCQRQTEDHFDHEFQYRLISRIGEAVWIRDYVQIIFEDDTPVGLRGFFIDISALKSAESERRALERVRQRHERLESLGLLAGSVSHDFNNLLVSLLGHAELMQMALPADHRARRQADTILDVCRQGAELCNQLLAYSGRGELSLRDVYLNDVAREIVRLTSPVNMDEHIVCFSLDNCLPMIKADVAQVRQVVMNLFTNALEAIQDGGTIVVSTGQRMCTAEFIEDVSISASAKPGTYAYVDVRDTGCGMSKEDLAHVLEPFFTTKESGTGLGLAGADGIMRTHNGFLSVQSQLHSGTLCRAYFPLTPVEEPLELPEPEAPAAPATILIVDDDRAMLNFMRRLVGRLGLEALPASSPREGLEYFDQHRGEIQAVLVDLIMPEMNGDKFAEALHERGVDVPVILVSGFDRETIEQDYSMEHVTGFMPKPFGLEDLEQALGITSSADNSPS